MDAFVRVLVDTLDCPSESLFSGQFQEDCLELIFTRNRQLLDLGANPWPEHELTPLVRTYVHQLKMRRLN